MVENIVNIYMLNFSKPQTLDDITDHYRQSSMGYNLWYMLSLLTCSKLAYRGLSRAWEWGLVGSKPPPAPCGWELIALRWRTSGVEWPDELSESREGTATMSLTTSPSCHMQHSNMTTQDKYRHRHCDKMPGVWNERDQGLIKSEVHTSVWHTNKQHQHTLGLTTCAKHEENGCWTAMPKESMGLIKTPQRRITYAY